MVVAAANFVVLHATREAATRTDLRCFFSVGMSAIRGSSPILPNWRRGPSAVARGLAFANEASLPRKTSIALTRMTMLRTVVPSYNSVQRVIDAKASRTNDAFRRWNVESNPASVATSTRLNEKTLRSGRHLRSERCHAVHYLLLVSHQRHPERRQLLYGNTRGRLQGSHSGSFETLRVPWHLDGSQPLADRGQLRQVHRVRRQWIGAPVENFVLHSNPSFPRYIKESRGTLWGTKDLKFVRASTGRWSDSKDRAEKRERFNLWSSFIEIRAQRNKSISSGSAFSFRNDRFWSEKIDGLSDRARETLSSFHLRTVKSNFKSISDSIIEISLVRKGVVVVSRFDDRQLRSVGRRNSYARTQP